MPTLDEVLGELADYVGDDKAKAREAALALLNQDTTKPIAEVLLKRGLSKRTADAEGRITELEGKLKDVQAELDEKTQEIEKSRNEAPDWKKKLDEQDARHRTKQDELKKQLDAERAGRRDDQLKIYRQRFLQELGPGTQVDPDYAETVLVAKYADRFQLDDDGNLRVLEPDETTAYDAGAGDPIKALAQDVLQAMPGKFRIVGQSSAAGSGVTGGSGGDLKPRSLEQVQESQRKQVGYATP